jgi:hypothetical protein
MGEPNNTYQWQVNGTNLDNETLSILMVLNITDDSGAEHTCIVSNPAGSHNTSMFLFVYPYFLSHPGDVQVSIGSVLLLACDTVEFQYLWQRANEMHILGNAAIDGRVSNITAKSGDGGEYYCIAFGRGTSIQSQNSGVVGKCAYS